MFLAEIYLHTCILFWWSEHLHVDALGIFSDWIIKDPVAELQTAQSVVQQPYILLSVRPEVVFKQMTWEAQANHN